ncbi:N-acetyltransferase family protein [Pseudomonas brenneri]|uniref:GNAT family N-acetyltransferase n=1 Tax=Pseudomonas brenneri TaxID=129817 RepID=UPI003570CE6D
MIGIREATIEDIPLLRNLGMATYREHFSDIWSAAGMQDFLNKDFSIRELQQSIESPACHCWLMAFDADNQGVGFAKINWSKPMPLPGQVGAELQKIYFLKTQAGRGYGKQLLQFIFQSAKNRQQGSIWLEVLKSNASAQRFYESCGFEVRGEIPFSTDKADIGMVVMNCGLFR